MAQLQISNLNGLILDLEEIAALPDAVAEQMLVAEAKIVEKAQREAGEKLGVHRTGVTLSAIKHGKMKRFKNGRVMYVSPQGVNKNGDKNGMVAFLNEYGIASRGIPPRPFIRTANAKAAGPAVDAAAAAYDRYLKTKNL